MLSTLRDMEVAVHMLAEDTYQKNLDRDPIDIHYDLLNAKIAPLPGDDVIIKLLLT